MIDLDNEEGVRNAFKTVAGWYGADFTDVGQDPEVIMIGPGTDGLARRRSLFSGAAAAVVLIVAVAVAVLAGRGEQSIAAANGAWSPMADAPLDPRFAPVTLWTGSELLVWGGHDAAGAELVDGAAYDPDRDRWRTMAPFPFEYERREGVGVGQDGGSTVHPAPGAWIDGKAVFVLASGERWGWQIVSYDPVEDRWDLFDEATFTQQADDSLALRTGTATVQVPYAAVAWQGKLLVFGWHSERHVFGWSEFDIASRRWGSFTGLPGSGALYGARSLPAHVTVVDGQYLVWVANRSFGTTSPAGYSVDLLSGTVTTLERPARAMRVDIGDLSDDGVVVGLGSDDDGPHRFAARLDPRTGRWSVVGPPPSGPAEDNAFGELVTMNSATAFVGGLGTAGLTIGGLRSEAAALVLGDDGRWHDLPGAPLDLSRVGAATVWTGESLLVWGGVTTADSGPVNLPVVPLADGAVYAFD